MHSPRSISCKVLSVQPTFIPHEAVIWVTFRKHVQTNSGTVWHVGGAVLNKEFQSHSCRLACYFTSSKWEMTYHFSRASRTSDRRRRYQSICLWINFWPKWRLLSNLNPHTSSISVHSAHGMVVCKTFLSYLFCLYFGVLVVGLSNR